MSNELNEKWIGVEEAAEYLGVKPSTVREWIKKQTGIPAHKIGKQWKFKISVGNVTFAQFLIFTIKVVHKISFTFFHLSAYS